MLLAGLQSRTLGASGRGAALRKRRRAEAAKHYELHFGEPGLGASAACSSQECARKKNASTWLVAWLVRLCQLEAPQLVIK